MCAISQKVDVGMQANLYYSRDYLEHGFYSLKKRVISFTFKLQSFFVLKLKDSRQTIFFQLIGTVPGPCNTFRSS